MLHLPLLPLAGILGLGAPEIIIIGIIFMMIPGMIIGIVAIALSFKFRQRQAWHELVRLALEKGQPIPPNPGGQWQDHAKWWQEFAMNTAAQKRFRRSRRRRDFRKGLMSLAFGAAVWFWAEKYHEPSHWLFFAYVPAFVGAALLVSALFEAMFSRNSDDTDAPPPQP